MANSLCQEFCLGHILVEDSSVNRAGWGESRSVRTKKFFVKRKGVSMRRIYPG